MPGRATHLVIRREGEPHPAEALLPGQGCCALLLATGRIGTAVQMLTDTQESRQVQTLRRQGQSGRTFQALYIPAQMCDNGMTASTLVEGLLVPLMGRTDLRYRRRR